MNISSIKSKIIIPMTAILLLVSSGTAIVTYYSTESSLQQKGLTTLMTAKIGIENALIARRTTEAVMEKEMRGQAVLASYLLEKSAVTYGELTELTKRSGIDEIWITDGAGRVELTNASPEIDFNFGSDPKAQAFEFMELITGKSDFVSQPAQPRTIDPKIYKYVGVSGWGGPRIVQVGRDGGKLTELESQIGAATVLSRLKSELGSDILFAGIAQGDGKLSFATDPDTVLLNGELVPFIKEAQSGSAYAIHGFKGERAGYYFAPLNDGSTLVMALSERVLRQNLLITVGAAAVGILLATVLLFLIVGRQTGRLKSLESAMNSIADGDGDLTQRLPVREQDEIGQLSEATNRFISKIQDIVQGVVSAASRSKADSSLILEDTGAAKSLSEEIHMAVHEIAGGAAKQAVSVEEGMSGVQELAQRIDRSRDRTQALHAYNTQIRSLQESGLTSIDALLKSIHSNVEMSGNVESSMGRLLKDIDAVREMALAIHGISRQTNLLALNASIEASRAGEHGLGFMVVAKEVRKLSEQAGGSAAQIQQMIESMISSAAVMSEAVRGSSIIVENQGAQVQVASGAFGSIREALMHIHQLTSEIAGEMDGLSSQKNDILGFIEISAASTQETAVSSEEMLAGMETQAAIFGKVHDKAVSLQNRMNQLHEAVSRFKL